MIALLLLRMGGVYLTLVGIANIIKCKDRVETQKFKGGKR